MHSALNENDAKQIAITKLTTEKIQRARRHPSTIILKALKTAGEIQTVVNKANYKIEELEKQEEEIIDTIRTLEERKQRNLEDLVRNESASAKAEMYNNFGSQERIDKGFYDVIKYLAD